VLLGGEHRFEPGALAVGEQRQAGVQAAPDPVERIAGAATVPEGVLLDALAAQAELVSGPGHGVEPIHHRHRVRDLRGAAFL
jgi:hypothetical protein